MKFRYIIFFTVIGLIHLFCWYYVTAFCAVYQQSQIGWLYGGIISLVVGMGIFEVVIPFMIACNHYIAIRCKWK